MGLPFQIEGYPKGVWVSIGSWSVADLPPETPTIRAARAAYDAGLIEMAQKREEIGQSGRYVIQYIWIRERPAHRRGWFSTFPDDQELGAQRRRYRKRNG